MNLYKIVNVYLQSPEMPKRYLAFQWKGEIPEGVLALQVSYAPGTDLEAPLADALKVNGIRISRGKTGWCFEDEESGCRMIISEDYASVTLSETVKCHPDLWGFLLQLFLEGRLLEEGVLTLHASCVDLDGRGYAFSGPSGCGKSTRAFQWVKSLRANFLSGDRPAVDVRRRRFYGIPWDGKEKFYQNRSVATGAIFEVRRSGFTRLRRLSKRQARAFLVHQLYLPMWDSDRAMLAMVLLEELLRTIPVYRLFCSRAEEAAVETRDILCRQPKQIREESREMTLKEGFVLKHMAGEYVLMPTGDKLMTFNGTVLLNEVSAFVIKQLEAGPVSLSDLADLVLEEYDAEKEEVLQDLRELSETLCEMGVASMEE